MTMRSAKTVAGKLNELPPQRRAALTAVRAIVPNHWPAGYGETMSWHLVPPPPGPRGSQGLRPPETPDERKAHARRKKLSVKVAPRPALFSAVMVPPWASMIRLHMLRPRP